MYYYLSMPGIYNSNITASSIIDPIARELAQRDIDDARARYLARDPDDMTPEYVPFRGDVIALAAHYALEAALLREALS